MLNGIDPIILFQFKKLLPETASTVAKIPVVADQASTFPLPVIPLYLSKDLTGIFIDSESKSIEVDTTIDTLSSGEPEKVNQRGIQNTVKIEMVANKDSIGISLFSALTDLIFPKLTSKEYAITYLHGPIVVIDGLLHSFSINQDAETTLYKISLEIMRPSAAIKTPIPAVGKTTGAVPL